MNLFFDQCIGSGVPKSLRLVGYRNIYYLESVFSYRISEGHIITDQEWLERVGKEGWLAITEDAKILERSEERAALVEFGVGIVILKAARLKSREVLAWMLRRWKWLEQIDQEPRPFAYRTSLNARPVKADLAHVI